MQQEVITAQRPLACGFMQLYGMSDNLTYNLLANAGYNTAATVSTALWFYDVLLPVALADENTAIVARAAGISTGSERNSAPSCADRTKTPVPYVNSPQTSPAWYSIGGQPNFRTIVE
jgi:hypothetical protein